MNEYKQNKISNSDEQPSRSRRNLKALLSAALAIPGLGLEKHVAAQSPPEAPIVRIRYADYRERQSGKEDRMDVYTPMVSLETPLGENDELQASYTYDSMSGASPYYLDVLSGASGSKIRDNRNAGDAKFTHYFEQFSLGIGGQVSDEDDYFSRGGLVDARIWTPDKNTTFSLGFSYDSDDISSSNDPTFGAHRSTQGYFVGVTQNLTPNSALQSNLGYTNARGYQSDPYKSYDNRPRSRGAWSWLSRYVLFFPEWESALHVDYRFFIDTWGIKSHTLELAWYQPLGSAWMFRPSVRYYSQDSAQFYTGSYPPPDLESNYSADQRLGAFGSFAAGVKLIRDLGKGFSADISFEAMLQKLDLRLGGRSEPELKDFYAGFLSVGVTKKF